MMRKIFSVLALPLLLTACVSIPVRTGTSDSKSAATGAAAGAYQEGANTALEHCDSTLGTMVVHENQYEHWYSYLSRHGIHSTVPVLRLFAQQSGCFVVVERGRSLKNVQQERAFEASGELRQGSNFGKGQMVAADYTLTPDLIFKDNNSGGIGGTLGGMLGGSIGAAIGSSLRFKTAQSVLTLIDNRSSVQVAAAEGSSRGTDLGAISSLFGSKGAGTLGAYTKTPEGRVIVAAMMDAYNNMVRAVRNYQPQKAAGPGRHGTGGKLIVE